MYTPPVEARHPNIMVQFFDEIPDFLFPWIANQKVFWVATAAPAPDGHINVSPKGLDGTFHIVNSRKVWYVDLTGSGTSPNLPSHQS